MARIGTDEHGNAGDGINDNGDKLRPNQYPLGATQGIEQPRIARIGHGYVGDDELLLPLVVKSKLSKLKTREMELTTMATILRPNQYPLGARGKWFR